MAEYGTAENTQIRLNLHLILDAPPTFLSNITCMATNYTSRVMVNITFPVMDEVVKV